MCISLTKKIAYFICLNKEPTLLSLNKASSVTFMMFEKILLVMSTNKSVECGLISTKHSFIINHTKELINYIIALIRFCDIVKYIAEYCHSPYKVRTLNPALKIYSYKRNVFTPPVVKQRPQRSIYLLMTNPSCVFLFNEMIVIKLA